MVRMRGLVECNFGPMHLYVNNELFEAIVHRILVSNAKFPIEIPSICIHLIDQFVEIADVLNVARSDGVEYRVNDICVSFVIVFSAARGSEIVLEGFNKELEGGHLVFIHESSIHQIQGLWGL